RGRDVAAGGAEADRCGRGGEARLAQAGPARRRPHSSGRRPDRLDRSDRAAGAAAGGARRGAGRGGCRRDTVAALLPPASVAGTSYATSAAANGDERTTWSPLGLRLIDVGTWTERMLDPGATGFALAPEGLVAYGATSPAGVAVYGADGSAKLRLLPARPVA